MASTFPSQRWTVPNQPKERPLNYTDIVQRKSLLLLNQKTPKYGQLFSLIALLSPIRLRTVKLILHKYWELTLNSLWVCSSAKWKTLWTWLINQAALLKSLNLEWLSNILWAPKFLVNLPSFLIQPPIANSRISLKPLGKATMKSNSRNTKLRKSKDALQVTDQRMHQTNQVSSVMKTAWNISKE